MNQQSEAEQPSYDGWRKMVARYQQPDVRASTWQVINSFGGLMLCLVAMYYALYVGYWLTLLLAIPAAGFLVRIFIIQHDCGHGSFTKSRRANDLLGMACSVFTWIPYKFWRKSHAIHHAHHAELEERGIGDVWTMTVDEYWSAPWWKKVVYRVFRNPFFLFGVAPTVNFVILTRFPVSGEANWKREEKASVWWLNLALAICFTFFGLLIGFGTVAAIYLPVMIMAGSAGVWLFYVQHQFERTYWEHTPQWDYTLAAMHGSSYYELPRVLQWFTGNIGFHHIHHLSPRIPNYNLQKCHEENPTLQRVVRLTIGSSIKTIWLVLWDEERNRLVTFREALQAKRAATVSV